MDIFLAAGTEEAADVEEIPCADNSAIEVAIILDNNTCGFKLDENLVAFKKRKAQPDRFDYFINQIQCRPKDIRELLVEAGIRAGSPVHEILLGDY